MKQSILDCSLKQVTRPVIIINLPLFVHDLVSILNYIPLCSFEWSIRYKYKAVCKVGSTKLMMRNRVLRVLLYNVASPQKCITDACSFLQGSKSISETLCGMYDLCFYMSHTRRLWNCFKTSMDFLELVHLLYQSLFCLSSKSLLSIKSRIFCLLIVVFDIGCVFIENLNLWSVTVTDKHNFTLSTINQSIEMEMPSLIVPAFVTITSSL